MTRARFVLWMAKRIADQSTSRDIRPLALARRVLSNFLTDSKISFGDPAYAWDQSAATDLINDWEIAYWECTP